MIDEATIERVLDRLEASPDTYEAEVADLADRQPELMDYLTNEDVEAFTEAERDLLLFATLVIFQSAETERPDRPVVEGEAIAKAEERNYELLAATKAPTFRDRLTPFFEQTAQEDLLAFIEDLTLAEGDDQVSPEAREPFFVTLKTVVDTLT